MGTKDEQSRQTVKLPILLAEAFQALRKGKHLCRADGPVWFDLRDDAEQYGVIFSALGYTLSDHPRGFYYFAQGQQARPDVLSRLVYFFACLFTDLDQGRFESGHGRWVDSLTDQDFDVPTVIESMFAANDRQRVFDQLNVTRDGFDKSVIAPLVRYGIASRPDSGRLRFRESVYRFVELFQTCGEDQSPVEAIATVSSDDELIDAAMDADNEEGEDDL
jgi:hypothetical protein